MNNRLMAQFLSEQGFTQGSLNKREAEFLAGEGYTSQLNESWYAYLKAQGLTGSLADMLYTFFKNGVPSVSYSPSALYGEDKQGAWGEVATTECWLDTARTIPAAGDGDLIASWRLRTVNGIVYAEQSTEASRPVYKLDGDKPYLDFNGSKLMVVAVFDMSASSEFTIIAGVQKAANTEQVIVELGTSYSGAIRRFNLNMNGSTYESSSRGSRALATGTVTVTASAFAATRKNVVTSLSRISPASSRIRVNGAYSGTENTSDKGSGNFSSSGLHIGGRGTGGLRLTGRVYALIIVGEYLSDAALAEPEAWVNERTGAY